MVNIPVLATMALIDSEDCGMRWAKAVEKLLKSKDFSIKTNVWLILFFGGSSERLIEFDCDWWKISEKSDKLGRIHQSLSCQWTERTVPHICLVTHFSGCQFYLFLMFVHMAFTNGRKQERHAKAIRPATRTCDAAAHDVIRRIYPYSPFNRTMTLFSILPINDACMYEQSFEMHENRCVDWDRLLE